MKQQPTPVFLPGELQEQYEKAKRYDTRRWATLPAPRSEGIQYTTREEQRIITNRSRKKEVAGPKQKQHLAVDGLVVKIKSDAVKNNIA